MLGDLNLLIPQIKMWPIKKFIPGALTVKKSKENSRFDRKSRTFTKHSYCCIVWQNIKLLQTTCSKVFKNWERQTDSENKLLDPHVASVTGNYSTSHFPKLLVNPKRFTGMLYYITNHSQGIPISTSSFYMIWNTNCLKIDGFTYKLHISKLNKLLEAKSTVLKIRNKYRQVGYT